MKNVLIVSVTITAMQVIVPVVLRQIAHFPNDSAHTQYF